MPYEVTSDFVKVGRQFQPVYNVAYLPGLNDVGPGVRARTVIGTDILDAVDAEKVCPRSCKYAKE